MELQPWERKLTEPPQQRPLQLPTSTNGTTSVASHLGQLQMSPLAVSRSHRQPQYCTTPLAQQPASIYSQRAAIKVTLRGNPTAGGGTIRVLTIYVPEFAIEDNLLWTILSGPILRLVTGLPPEIATQILQQHVDTALQGGATSEPTQNRALDLSTRRASEVNATLSSQLPTSVNGAGNVASHMSQMHISSAAGVNQYHQYTTPEVITVGISLYDNRVPIQIVEPDNSIVGSGKPKVITVYVPTAALENNLLYEILTAPLITAAMGFPPNTARVLLQEYLDREFQRYTTVTSM